MFEFLLAVSKDTWATLLTSLAARNLAMAVEELNETFLASKITLRCRMFSLFASEPEGKWVKKVCTCLFCECILHCLLIKVSGCIVLYAAPGDNRHCD